MLRGDLDPKKANSALYAVAGAKAAMDLEQQARALELEQQRVNIEAARSNTAGSPPRVSNESLLEAYRVDRERRTAEAARRAATPALPSPAAAPAAIAPPPVSALPAASIAAPAPRAEATQPPSEAPPPRVPPAREQEPVIDTQQNADGSFSAVPPPPPVSSGPTTYFWQGTAVTPIMTIPTREQLQQMLTAPARKESK